MADLLQQARNSRQRRRLSHAAPSSSGGRIDGLPASSPAMPFAAGLPRFVPSHTLAEAATLGHDATPAGWPLFGVSGPRPLSLFVSPPDSHKP